MRNPLLLAVLLAACGGPSKSPTPSPALPAVAAEPARPVEGARPAVPVVDATPDAADAIEPARVAELAKLAKPLFEVVTNGAAVFTRDGKRVAFVSNRDGLPQLYIADAGKPDAPVTRLVTSPDRVTALAMTPDGKALVFSSDRGADENWAHFRVNLDGSGLVALTPNAKWQRDGVQFAERKPDTLYYSARAMADVATGVYRTSALAPGEETLIYRDDKPGSLIDVSDDGKWALYQRVLSHGEAYLLLLDLTAGTVKQLYPKDGKVQIFDAAFSSDGKRAILATDAGAEQSLVVSLDLATGKETARYVETRPATASVSGLSVARRGNTLALVLDAGNHGDVRVLDATTLKPRTQVAVPLGAGYTSGISDDGKRLALNWSSPTTPNDIYAVELATGKLTALRKEARPQLDALPAVEASITQVDAFDGAKIPVNVYLPAGARDKKLPVIVSYHGGPAGNSQVRWASISRFFLSQGYAWVEPNVRGSSGFGRAYEAADDGPRRLDGFKDIEATGAWVAAQPWADKDRLVIYGGSYGGYTVLVGLTRMAKLWRAGVDLVGVANLKTFMATTSGLIHELFLVEFGDPDKDAAFLDSISPLRDADKIVDPLFVYAGANDPRVPRSESDLIVKALRARKVPVEYMVKDNEGHSLGRRENQIEFCARVARFLETHVK